MRAEVSEAEALLLGKRAIRVGNAKVELAKPAIFSGASLCWAIPLLSVIFGDPLAHYYGVSTSLLFLLSLLLGGIAFSMAEVFSLQRKVRALTELLQLQHEADAES